MRTVFKGSGVALITPFFKDGKIDYSTFLKLIEFQIANKTDAIIVCGTTGEGSTLTVEERINLFSLAVQQTAGRVPVIAGTGSNSTSFSQELAKEAEKCGIDAHLSVTPYYNKASQEGLVKHYYSLADKAEKPIIVYNVPTRTCVNIQPETYKKLGEHENIIGVKEADSNISKLNKSIAVCEDTLDFYVGNDDMISTGVYSGCKGVVSVLSNILPEFTHNLTTAALNGDITLSNKMQYKISDLTDALFIDINPIPVKEIMNYLWGIGNYYRLPLCKTNTANRVILQKIADKYKNLFPKEVLLN